MIDPEIEAKWQAKFTEAKHGLDLMIGLYHTLQQEHECSPTDAKARMVQSMMLEGTGTEVCFMFTQAIAILAEQG